MLISTLLHYQVPNSSNNHIIFELVKYKYNPNTWNHNNMAKWWPFFCGHLKMDEKPQSN